MNASIGIIGYILNERYADQRMRERIREFDRMRDAWILVSIKAA